MSDWAAFVGYHLACVERASVTEPALLSSDSWAVLPIEVEQVICGEADDVPLGEGVDDLVRTAGVFDSLYHGWPLVVVSDRTGRSRVAPLVLTGLEGTPGASGRAVAKDDEPYLNAGLLCDEYFTPDDLAAVDERLASGLPFGETEAMVAVVADILRLLDVQGAEAITSQRLVAQPARLTPGVHNLAGIVRGPAQIFTRMLIEELRALQKAEDWDRTAARHLLVSAAEPVSASWAPVVGPLRLNDAQEQAVGATASAPLTVITGPPGTGKSQLVAAIVANAWARQETVLVGSTNNGAVDVAVRRAAEIDHALLLRTGNRAQRDALPSALQDLAARCVGKEPTPAVLHRRFEAAVTRRHGLHQQIEERSADGARLAQVCLDLEALRRVLWGLSTPPELDRTGRVDVRRRARRAQRARFRARRRRDRVLRSLVVDPVHAGIHDVITWVEAEQERDELTDRLSARTIRDDAAEAGELARVDDEWAAASAALVRSSVTATLTAPGAASQLRQMAQLRPHSPKARSDAFLGALRFARGWACTALSVQATFPLKAGLFDLVVVDEASQCGIAEVLPLAYRAKRMVIVGDPNQLTPVVTLTRAQLESLALAAGTSHDDLHKRGLACGADSAYTAFASRVGDAVHLLDEHYRCHPSVAGFINRFFYGGRLRVLTDIGRLAGAERGLEWVPVQGRTERGAHGGALNSAEASAVVEWVATHALPGVSLGVVTPFAAQAALFKRGLERRVPHEVRAQIDLTTGTAHRFQGDERDVVLFSPVVSAGALPATARWVEQQRNLLNVAVSRARSALVVIGDDTAPARFGLPTLAALHDAATGRIVETSVAPGAIHSEAERRLLTALEADGLAVVAKAVVEGYELDFAVFPDQECALAGLNVECDGGQHIDVRGRQRRQDLARDAILGRAGWQVVRLLAWQCLQDPQGAAARVRAAWADHAAKVSDSAGESC